MCNLKFLQIKLLVAWMCSIIIIFHYINAYRFKNLNTLMFTGSKVWFRQSIQSTLDISNLKGLAKLSELPRVFQITYIYTYLLISHE